MASVSLQQIRKSYGPVPVVKGLDLHIASGEMVALLGPSGCGKTTTLRMIAGLEKPDSGRLLIGDREVDGPTGHLPPEARSLGMVFQSYAVWPHRTVAENVAYPLSLRKLPRVERDRRVQQALDQVRLGAFGHRRPHELSGGQLQRVALARALVAEPKVLLLDEPLSNLDAALREELRGELAALRTRLRITMVYVTHDQTEALALADRIAVMNKGVLEQVAVPRTLYAEPATPFVAGFVGGANVLTGRLDGTRFVSGTQTLTVANPDKQGDVTLVVRPEDVELKSGGDALPLSATLYLGHSTEYRFDFNGQVLRAIAPTQSSAPTAVMLKTVRLY